MSNASSLLPGTCMRCEDCGGPSGPSGPSSPSSSCKEITACGEGERCSNPQPGLGQIKISGNRESSVSLFYPSPHSTSGFQNLPGSVWLWADGVAAGAGQFLLLLAPGLEPLPPQPIVLALLPYSLPSLRPVLTHVRKPRPKLNFQLLAKDQEVQAHLVFVCLFVLILK